MSDEIENSENRPPAEPAPETRPNPLVTPSDPPAQFAPPAGAALPAPEAADPATGTTEPDSIVALRTRGAALVGAAPDFLNRRYLTGVVSHLGVAVVSAVVVALLTIALLIADALRTVASSGDTGGSAAGDNDLSAFTVFRLMFGWLLSLAFGGHIHAHGGLDAGDTSIDLSLTLHGAPVLLTAAVVVLTVWAGIRIEKLTPTTSWQWRVIAGAATGLVAAGIVSVLGTTLGSGSLKPSGDFDVAASVHLSAGGPGVFFTSWLVLGLAAIVGRQVGAWGGWRRIVTNAPTTVRDLTIWGSALTLVFGAAAIVLGVIAGVRGHEFLNLLLTFPLWLGQVIVWAATLGHLGAVNLSTGGLSDALDAISGSGSVPDLDQGLSVFSITGGGVGYVWVLFALAVLAVLWSGLRIGVARAQRAAGYGQRALVVVIAAVLALLVPVLLTDLRVSASGASGLVRAIGASIHGSLANAGWAFLVFALAAVLVDVVATYLAPLVAVGAPWLISAIGYGVLRREDGEPVPMTPVAKKASIWAGSVLGGLVVMAGLFFGVVAVLNSTVFTPEKPVAAYLGLISQGDVKGAAAAQSSSGHAVATVVLGTDVTATAKPATTITDAKVLSVSSSSSTSMAKISYRLDGTTYKDTIEVARKDGGLFDHWVVATPLTSAVTVKSGTDAAAQATLGGASVTIKNGEGRFTVFPGVYSVKGKSSTLLSSKPVSLTAGKGGGSATISWSYTPAATAQLQKAVNAWIASDCVGDNSGDCYLVSKTERNDPDSEYDDTWANATYPVITLHANGSFTTATAGAATASWTDYSFDDTTFDVSETKKSAKESYYVDGEFTVSGDTITLTGAEGSTDPSELYYQSKVQASGS